MPYGAHYGQLERLPETTRLLPGLPEIGAIRYNEVVTNAKRQTVVVIAFTAI